MSVILPIGSNSNPGGNGTTYTTTAFDSTGANLLIIATTRYNFAGPIVISDSKSNTWTALTAYENNTSAGGVQLYYCQPTSVGSGHTATISGSSALYGGLTFMAFSGAAASSITDGEVGQAVPADSTFVQPGSLTPTAYGDLHILGAKFVSTLQSLDIGTLTGQWVHEAGVRYGGAHAYYINPSNGALDPTFTVSPSERWSATQVAFKAAPPPAPAKNIWRQQPVGRLTTSDLYNQRATPVLIGSTFWEEGTPDKILAATLFTNSNSFFAPTVSQPAGGQTVTQASRFDNSNSFFAPTVTAVVILTQASRFDNSPTFYAPTVTRGSVTVTQSARYDNSQTFYGPTVTRGAVTLLPSLVTNTNSFFAPTVTVGAVTLLPGLFTNSNTFYAATVSQAGGGTQNLTQASRFDNANAFLGHSVSPGSVVVAPSRLDNTSTFFPATVTPGQVILSLSRLNNTQIFYSANVSNSQTVLNPSRFDNTNTFFQHNLGNQYPSPNTVLSGIRYGPTNNLTGTMIDPTGLKLDLTTGKLVKVLNSKVTISF